MDDCQFFIRLDQPQEEIEALWQGLRVWGQIRTILFCVDKGIRDIFERRYSFADIQLLLFQLPGAVYGIGRALTDRSNVGCNCRSSLWCLQVLYALTEQHRVALVNYCSPPTKPGTVQSLSYSQATISRQGPMQVGPNSQLVSQLLGTPGRRVIYSCSLIFNIFLGESIATSSSTFSSSSLSTSNGLTSSIFVFSNGFVSSLFLFGS